MTDLVRFYEKSGPLGKTGIGLGIATGLAVGSYIGFEIGDAINDGLEISNRFIRGSLDLIAMGTLATPGMGIGLAVGGIIGALADSLKNKRYKTNQEEDQPRI